MADKAVLASITGRVQGVYYRGWTQSEATRLGLRGWVRNEDDGSVTALIAGPEDRVSQMLKALWEGPSGAAVAAVTTHEADLDGDLPEHFNIAR